MQQPLRLVRLRFPEYAFNGHRQPASFHFFVSKKPAEERVPIADSIKILLDTEFQTPKEASEVSQQLMRAVGSALKDTKPLWTLDFGDRDRARALSFALEVSGFPVSTEVILD